MGHAPAGEIRCSEIDSESIFAQKQSHMYSTYMVHSVLQSSFGCRIGPIWTFGYILYKKLEGPIMFKAKYTVHSVTLDFSIQEISVHVYCVCRLPCQ